MFLQKLKQDILLNVGAICNRQKASEVVHNYYSNFSCVGLSVTRSPSQTQRPRSVILCGLSGRFEL